MNHRWPPRLRRLAFGGDYNPEQWPREVWAEDCRLMQEAGVSVATVGVFSWALLEPARGHYDFGWLDDVLDGLHGAGIAVCLATPTASPPPWLSAEHPETLPVTPEGVRLGIGAREHFCPSSPAYRAAAVSIAEQLARRYADHPAVALWHIGNEYGAHVGACCCDLCAAEFTRWLQRRYADLDALNTAWGTAFWGQRYGEWSHVRPPRPAPMPVNPAQQLDHRRFASDQHLACYVGERDAVRAITPDIPITTNLMATNSKDLDYWRWAGEVDLIANNHYLVAEAPDNQIELALSADLSRGLARGGPWLLMETSTSAVNWQPRNVAKLPGELRRSVLSHIARGADGAMFFQWRASRFGAEKFHSAMLPQSGTSGRVWREVVDLGRELGLLSEVQGSRVAPDVALVWDWQSWWALELEFRPSVDVRYRDRVATFYDALWRRQLTTDLVAPTADLSAYPMVVVPSLYLTTPEATASLTRYVEGGGTLVVSFFSGIVDDTDTVHAGPYPGGLRELLGLWVDEFHPLRAGEQVELRSGRSGTVWSEAVELAGAEAVDSFASGPDAGAPAVTRHRVGRGSAWYVATSLSPADTGRLLDDVLAAIPGRGYRVDRPVPAGVEVVRRVGPQGSYTFAINHLPRDVVVPVTGTDLLTGAHHDGELPLPAGGAAVVREE